MKLHDTSIAQIAKLIQIAILTGTDIVDQLRTIQFVDEDGTLKVDPEYQEIFDKNINQMIGELQQEEETTPGMENQLPLF